MCVRTQFLAHVDHVSYGQCDTKNTGRPGFEYMLCVQVYPYVIPLGGALAPATAKNRPELGFDVRVRRFWLLARFSPRRLIRYLGLGRSRSNFIQSNFKFGKIDN